mmetsp:Transcript_78851/g.191049  ORF Transcript_78851/g.191049 Transcript_78851/m.191049 type:complete len:219 (+) Transcript_78851:44-700(+)
MPSLATAHQRHLLGPGAPPPELLVARDVPVEAGLLDGRPPLSAVEARGGGGLAAGPDRGHAPLGELGPARAVAAAAGRPDHREDLLVTLPPQAPLWAAAATGLRLQVHWRQVRRPVHTNVSWSHLWWLNAHGDVNVPRLDHTLSLQLELPRILLTEEELRQYEVAPRAELLLDEVEARGLGQHLLLNLSLRDLLHSADLSVFGQVTIHLLSLKLLPAS